MASDTKQQTTYKKRVISESDDEDSSASAGANDGPLARAADHGQEASAAGAPAMEKTASNESRHNPQDVAAGSVLLKEAAGHPEPSQPPPHIEDAHLRHEIAASGFPVDVAAASSATGAHAHSGTATNGQAVAKDSQMDEDNSSDDDDKPLAAKAAESDSQVAHGQASVTTALPSFTKANASAKPNQDDSSSDDGRPLALNFDKKKTKKPSSKSKPRSSDRRTKSQPVKEEASSDEDVPLSKQTNGKVKTEGDGAGAEMDIDESSDDDTPLAAQTKAKPQVKEKANGKKKRAKAEDSDFAEEDSKPKKKKTKVKSDIVSESTSNAKGKAKVAKVKKEEAASQVQRLQAKMKEEEEDSQAAGGSQRDDDEDDDEYKWWKAKMEEEGEDDDGPKWTTLQHSGVLFPPEYQPLPPNVKLKYDGKPVDLPPESEEVAGFFAAMVETEHASDPVFRQNFFNDFLGVLAEFPPRNKVKIDPVNGMDRLDFSDMHQHFEIEKEKRKSMTKEEKKKAKEEKDALEKPYKTCLIDGREEIVGNFRLEPPGLFRGRGQHPKKGKLKKRINASQITINIGKDAVRPKPPPGQEWGAVVHKQDVTWLANWQENVNNNFKYVFLAAGSSWKGQSDFKKYEKARELKKCIGRIRLDYERDLTSKVMADRQRATAVYFIDRFALRVGNEKGEDEADTVGCCSLRYEHITLAEPNLVTFDFLGKDSIRFYQPDKEVDVQVFKNLKLFKKGGKEGDAIFDRVKPELLNKFFGNYMKGLSAKVFRTYNASFLLQQQLLNTPKDVSVADKLLHYNRANRLVAEMCNHQRAVSKTHGQAMEKLSDKVRSLKYQRMKLRYTLWTIDPDNKKKHKQYREMESDLEDDWMEKHEEELVEKERAKIKKKWEKDNEKRKAEGEKELSEKELKDMLKAADEFGKEIKTERKKHHVEPRKAQTTAKVLEAIAKLDERIDAQKLQALDREEGKEVSLTTSKINYMDPRVTVAWCKQHGVPLDKLYSKTLRTKFVWAMEVDENWQF